MVGRKFFLNKSLNFNIRNNLARMGTGENISIFC